MNNSNNCGNCINEILNVILVLQDNATPDSCLDTCDRPMLGGGPSCLICNTRPVMLYTCSGNGIPWYCTFK
ncbi:MAG: CotY/CotZ family spore coat protein [bacterium]